MLLHFFSLITWTIGRKKTSIMSFSFLHTQLTSVPVGGRKNAVEQSMTLNGYLYKLRFKT